MRYCRGVKWLVVVVLAACQSGVVPNSASKPPPVLANAAPAPLNAHRYDIGFRHACARTSDGRVACWGINDRGQLGDGTRIDRTTPVVVPGLTDIEGVAASDEHSCAWDTAGAVWCWGGNSVGEYTLAPVRISVAPVSKVLAGGTDTCALLRDHNVGCWFPETWRQGAAVAIVPEVRGATDISVGRYYVAAILANGDVAQWMPSTAGPTDMMKVPGLAGATEILADRGFSDRFLVRRRGAWLSWRVNTEDKSPIIAPLPAAFAPVALDELHACQLVGGAVSCIALKRDTDAFGDELGASAVIENTGGAVDVRLSSTAPLSHPPVACASFADGSLRCWGPASSLGGGERSTVERATEIAELEDVVELASLDDDSSIAICARRRSGRVACWGGFDAIGEVPQRTPRDLGISDATAMLADNDGVCVTRGAKKTTCYSEDAPLDTPYRFTARSAPLLGGWCDLDARGAATCTWPHEEKPIEQPEGDGHPVPPSVGPLRRMWLGWGSGCGERRADGLLTCWFMDARKDSPTFNDKIVGTFQATAIDAAILPNYTVHSDEDFCFVRPDGQVGCISTLSFDRFDLVPGIADAVEIATGNGGFCARTRTGRVACWSETFRRNAEPASDGTFEGVAFVEGIDDATHIAGNKHAMCALRKTGHVACWGHRDYIGSSTAERGATTVSGLKL
jgi:hypothetical protein